MRKLIFNIHLYVALLAGLFVAILGLTGAIMAFEPELDRLVHARLAYVTPENHAPLSLADLGRAALVGEQRAANPDAPVTNYVLAGAPDRSAEVDQGRIRTFLNPYSGLVLGRRLAEPDALSYIHALHLRLALGGAAGEDVGKPVMSLVALAILFLALSGLYLWWPRKRFRLGAPGAKENRRIFWFDLHNTLGVLALVFIAVLSATGAVIGFEDVTTPLFYRMTNSAPAPRPIVPAPPPDAQPITPDQALEIARAALPGASPFNINVPGPKAAYLIRARTPDDRTPGGRSQAMVDQYTGAVLYAQTTLTAPAGTSLVTLNRAIHTGDIIGIPSKAVVSLASLILALQAVSGVMMWIKRRFRARALSPEP